MRLRLEHLVTLIGIAVPAVGGCATPVPAAGFAAAARVRERPSSRPPERERPCWRRTDDTLLPPGRTLRASRCETAGGLEAACGDDDERACYGAHRLAALAKALEVDAVFLRSWMHQDRDTERELVESKMTWVGGNARVYEVPFVNGVGVLRVERELTFPRHVSREQREGVAQGRDLPEVELDVAVEDLPAGVTIRVGASRRR